MIAPRVDGVVDPPVLPPNAAGLYAISGAGFAPSAATTLKFGSVSLNYTSAPTPGNGEFNVNATGTGITFKPPSSAPGAYSVLLAVNGFAASTGWVVVTIMNCPRLNFTTSRMSAPSPTARRLLALTRLRARVSRCGSSICGKPGGPARIRVRRSEARRGRAPARAGRRCATPRAAFHAESTTELSEQPGGEELAAIRAGS